MLLVSQGSPFTLYYDGVANGVLSSNVNKHIHPGGALYIGVVPTHKNNLLADGKSCILQMLVINCASMKVESF